MCRKLIYSVLFILVLGPAVGTANAADPNLVGWWTFDDEGTGTVLDYSGNGRDGSLVGDPQFVTGMLDEALEFDGDDYVTIDGYKGVLGTHPFSITAWIKTANTATQQIIHWGTHVEGQRLEFRIQANRLRVSHGAGNAQGNTNVTDGEWHHVAAALPENCRIDDVRFYVDGQDDTRSRSDPDIWDIVANPTLDLTIGWRPTQQDRPFIGLIDDVRIYDKVLTPAEVQELAKIPKAYSPSPADGATREALFVVLSWTPGDYAAQHDVYFGENFADVDAGTPDTAKARQSDTFYHVPVLEVGTTYYWRVDDIEADGTTIHRGDVWSFTVPSLIASNPSPSEDAGYMDPDVTLSWTGGLGAILHDVYFGDNSDDVNEGTGDTAKGRQPETTYTPDSLALDTVYYWRIDEVEADMTTVHKGDVWSFKTMPDIAISDPNLIGWWMFDEGTGARALDWSGHGHHGAIRGDAEWLLPGWIGDGALGFDSMNDYVAIQDLVYASSDHAETTVCAWIRTSNSDMQAIASFDRSEYWRLEVGDSAYSGPGEVGWEVSTSTGIVDLVSWTRVDDGQWHHVTGVFDNGILRIYIDGRLEIWASGGTTFGTADTRYGFIGSQSEATVFDGDRSGSPGLFDGALDDVRIYDKALTAEEIALVMRGDPLLAWDPGPATFSIVDIDEVKSFTWSPGDNAAQHDVYFGTDEDAVTDADASDTTGIYRGRQSGTSYTPTEAFAFGQTYYWRIDEYNTDATITTGRVWSFTVAEYLIVDDFEDYDDFCDRIFYTWTDGWGYSGDPDCGVEVSAGNGTGSTVGHLKPPFAEQTIVHEGRQATPFDYDNVTSPYYSETERIFDTPQDWTKHDVKALTLWFRGYPPSFSTFAEGPPGTYTMTARSANISGQDDHFHYVFQPLSGVGTIVAKIESVTNTDNGAKAGVMVRETPDPNSRHAFVFFRADGGVRFNRRLTAGEGTTSFNPGTTYAAPHWVKLERHLGGSFRAYHSTDGSTWEELDSQVMVQMDNDVYIGLAVASNNTAETCEAVFSEVVVTDTVTGPWQSQEIGIESNAAEQLYVAVQDSAGQVKVVNNNDPNATVTDTWQEWNIDLREFSNAGVNLASIKQMHIGVGNRNSPRAGGTGSLYFDDIRLYRPRCVPSLAKPTADLSDNCVVDYADIALMASEWLATTADLTADLNADDNVNLQDYAILADAWLDELLWPQP